MPGKPVNSRQPCPELYQIELACDSHVIANNRLDYIELAACGGHDISTVADIHF